MQVNKCEISVTGSFKLSVAYTIFFRKIKNVAYQCASDFLSLKTSLPSESGVRYWVSLVRIMTTTVKDDARTLPLNRASHTVGKQNQVNLCICLSIY